MSRSFTDILSKKLGKDIREGSQSAEILSAITSKALDFSGTVRLRADEYLNDDDITKAEDSASEYMDNVLEEFADNTIEKMLLAKFDKREKGGLKIKAAGLLRDKNGRIISPLKLSILLEAVLYRYVQELMGTGGRLRNRTGRLAHSGTITNIAQVGKSKVSFMFRYQTAPYSVFEPGGRMGSAERSPKELFTQAIKNALNDLLSPKGSVLERDRIIRMVR